MCSPSHECEAQLLEGHTGKAFGEDVTKLPGGVNFLEQHPTWTNMGAEPMVFDCIVLGLKSHIMRLKLGQGEGTNIVFVDLGVKIRSVLNGNAKAIAKFMHKNKKMKENLAGGSQYHILCLHDGESNMDLNQELPQNRTPSKIDDIAGATTSTV